MIGDFMAYRIEEIKVSKSDQRRPFELRTGFFYHRLQPPACCNETKCFMDEGQMNAENAGFDQSELPPEKKSHFRQFKSGGVFFLRQLVGLGGELAGENFVHRIKIKPRTDDDLLDLCVDLIRG